MSKTNNTNNKRKWFQKGEFEDGYQFGDIYKTLRATGRDVTSNLFAGAAGIVENAIDAGAYVAGGVGDLFGADKFKDKTSQFIKKDSINEEKVGSVLGDVVGSSGINALIDRAVLGKDYRKKYDDYSLLGEKSDSLVQSGGQLAAQIGLQAAGVPWWVTTGVTSFGGGTEEALNDGATYGQAGLYGVIQAGSDILTEKLFGGSGLGERGLINLDKLTKGISNKAVKRLLDFGIDIGANGLEEDVALFFSDLGSALYKEEKLKDILWNENKLDEYLEAFIGGSVLGSSANLGKIKNAYKNKIDYRTGLTTNEEKVLNKAYEGKIAEVEKGGKKLTGKEKVQIYDNALQRVKSGEVDTQTVEAALGGEDYSAYKNTLDNYNALKQQLNELESIDNRFKTLEQATKEVEIKQRLAQTEIQADKLKNILQNRVAEKIDTDNIHLKDRESYLWDSYIKDLPKITNNTLNDVKPLESIDEKAVIEGIWEDSPNKSKKIVEKSQLESVENVGEDGIIEETRVLTLDDLTKDVLKTKPPYSPRPKRWIKNGGSVAIDTKGTWIYTDSNGVTVKYTDGYPDFETAGVVEQKVNIGGFKNRTSDVRKANALVSGGPCKKGYVWHHSQDGQTMMLIKEEIHKKFTHRGGFSLMKMKRRE